MDLQQRIQAFLKLAQEDSKQPQNIQVLNEESPYVEMKLGLGVYDVEKPSLLGYTETVGLISCTEDTEEYKPGIEEIQQQGWKNRISCVLLFPISSNFEQNLDDFLD